jgi:hypothetical protein
MYCTVLELDLQNNNVMAFQNIKIQIEERNLNKYIDTALKKYK